MSNNTSEGKHLYDAFLRAWFDNPQMPWRKLHKRTRTRYAQIAAEFSKKYRDRIAKLEAENAQLRSALSQITPSPPDTSTESGLPDPALCAASDSHVGCLDCHGTGWYGGHVRGGACDVPRR